MIYALSPWTWHSASIDDSDEYFYVPGAIDAIDLRSDSTIVTGWAVASFPNNAILPAGSHNLGDTLDRPLTNQERAAIKNELNTQDVPVDYTLRQMIEWLLVVQASDTDSTKWRPLRVDRDNYLRIRLGQELIVNRPVPAGGAVHTDDFNRADNSASLGGSWVNELNTWGIVSNHAEPTTASADNFARLDLALNSVDHYSKASFIQDGTTHGAGPVVRASNTSVQGYYGGWRYGSNGRWRIYKIVDGVWTLVAESAASGPTAGVAAVYRMEANGSSLDLTMDGVSKLTATDTTITTGVYGGLLAYSSGTNQDVDDFEAGDLAVDPVISLTRVHTAGQATNPITFSVVQPADGALLVITVAGRPDEIGSVTDNGDANNTWSFAIIGPAGDDQSGILYKVANTTDAANLTSVTVTGTQTSNYELVYSEFLSSVGWSANPLDQTALEPVTLSVASTSTGTTAATSAAHQVAIAMAYIRGVTDPGAVSWTNDFIEAAYSKNQATMSANTAVFNNTSYKILSATGSQSSVASWPNTANSAKGFIATFKVAGSGDGVSGTGSITATSTITAQGFKSAAGTSNIAGTANLAAIGSLGAISSGLITVSADIVASGTIATEIERLAPDGILAMTNLTGQLSYIQDDPDAADANWLVVG